MPRIPRTQPLYLLLALSLGALLALRVGAQPVAGLPPLPGRPPAPASLPSFGGIT